MASEVQACQPAAVNGLRISSEAQVQMLRNECERLRRALRAREEDCEQQRQLIAKLRAERDDYLQCVYAWAREKMPPVDEGPPPKEEELIPIEEVLRQLDEPEGD